MRGTCTFLDIFPTKDELSPIMIGRPGRIEDEGTIQPRDNRDPATAAGVFFLG